MLAKDLKNQKVRPECPYCGSSDLLIEAYVRWNISGQSWEIAELTANNVCNRCGRDVPEPKWVLEGDDKHAKRRLPTPEQA